MTPLEINRLCQWLIDYRDMVGDRNERDRLADVCNALDGYAKLTRAQEQWKPMSTRPEDVECFLAAVEVHNQRTGMDSWDIHLVTLDDETGEINEDTGWTLEDYTWWAPRPTPPVGIGASNPTSSQDQGEKK